MGKRIDIVLDTVLNWNGDDRVLEYPIRCIVHIYENGGHLFQGIRFENSVQRELGATPVTGCDINVLDATTLLLGEMDGIGGLHTGGEADEGIGLVISMTRNTDIDITIVMSVHSHHIPETACGRCSPYTKGNRL